MKKLLLSTAILAASTLTASAQDLFRGEAAPDEIRASDFMGMRVYASEAAVEGEEIEGLQEGWEDIGEINDMVLSRDGSVEAVLVDVGGFLGIGERQVAVSMDQLRMVADSATPDDVNDYFLVINADRAAIEGAPDYMTMGAAGTEPTDEVATETTEATTKTAEATTETTTVEMDTSEATENAVEETGEEVADAGAEAADEVADAGEEVTEEVAQADMSDTQEDAAEVADEQADATEEATEETAQAGAEAADEQADTAEAVAEGNTESETEAMDTAEAATDDAATTEMAATDQAETTTTEVPVETAEADDAAETDEALAGAGTETASAEGEARVPLSREGYVALGADQMTADNLEGAAVYDANDERVGEVGEIILAQDGGQVAQLVIDVGGFLGLGEKPVALEMSSLDILQQEGGDDLRVYVSQSREELEAMERFEAE